MFTPAALILATAALPCLATSSYGAIRQSRELSYAMRQLYARETYAVSTVPDPPTCASGYDATDPMTGQCICGPGRVQFGPYDCAVANGGGEYNVQSLDAPVEIGIPVTWSAYVSGPGDVLNAAQCGGICSEDPECMGFYLQPGATHADTAYCWEIGGAGVYDDPSQSPALPVTDQPNQRLVRRGAAGRLVFIGAPGGQLGVSQSPTDPNSSNPTVGCNAALGDQASLNFTGCTCGPGRVSNGAGYCTYAPSAGAKLPRRSLRNVANPVPW